MRLHRIAAALVAAATVFAGSVAVDGVAHDLGSLDTTLSVERDADRVALPRRATIIGDSAMAGVRWNGALDGFRGFDADDRLESCRRLVDTSCRGREGRRPLTALREISGLPAPSPTDVLIIATGYNDIDVKFPIHVRIVLDAAVAKGYRTVVWITYREDVTYELPGEPERAASNYRAMNAELRAIELSGAYPSLQLWDLDDYTRFVSDSWFADDGVHHLRRGSWGVADWISRKMAHISGRPCPMPWGRAHAQEQLCSDPNEVRPVRGYPQLDAMYVF